MTLSVPERSRAQESRAAIEGIYVIMRHLFVRGSVAKRRDKSKKVKQELKIF